VFRSGDNLPNYRIGGANLRAKVAKMARWAKRAAADIGNIRKVRDNAARHFSSAFVQGISGTGH
ncbi:MAG TPA: hypothetical protein VMV45_14165, partial [Casimicrobiaceae bacterium]|nr:hypothetical protein [Casimicrobiaceae bacterium]